MITPSPFMRSKKFLVILSRKEQKNRLVVAEPVLDSREIYLNAKLTRQLKPNNNTNNDCGDSFAIH
jgi:hypothetical protein